MTKQTMQNEIQALIAKGYRPISAIEFALHNGLLRLYDENGNDIGEMKVAPRRVTPNFIRR